MKKLMSILLVVLSTGVMFGCNPTGENDDVSPSDNLELDHKTDPGDGDDGCPSGGQAGSGCDPG